jgi:hypothetical protein
VHEVGAISEAESDLNVAREIDWNESASTQIERETLNFELTRINF